MKVTRNKVYILNYLFVACLLILVVNDHYLKYAYGNWLTGKLSDMAGIILLPLLITYLFPSAKERSILISALLFTFWKSPFSQGLIVVYNRYAFIEITRVVDYTDLLVFSLLPLPYLLIKNTEALAYVRINKVNPLLVLLPTAFSLMATAPPKSYYYTRSDGNLQCYTCHFTVNYTQDEIVAMLRKANIVFDQVTAVESDPNNSIPYRYEKGLIKQNTHFYKLNQLVIDKDTLRNIDFSMRTIRGKKTKIYFNGMDVPDDLSTDKLWAKARKYYRGLLFKALKSKLKE
jgi:hypothetical protein